MANQGTRRDVGSEAEEKRDWVLGPSYRKSWALVVGISDYGGNHAPLPNARRDAEAFCELLRSIYGFDDVDTLYDDQATSNAILSWLRGKVTTDTDSNDRVVFFFAGHGTNQISPTGALRGYLVPADAKPKQFADFIDMEELPRACGWMKAKHMFIILDCCFSGVAAICSRGEPASAPATVDDAYLQRITSRKAWQILTAGASDELVADQGPSPEHSPFTGSLLRGLGGEADENYDNLITATELAAWVRPTVTRETSQEGGKGQSPFFNYLAGSEEGDFVFSLPGSGPLRPERRSQRPQELVPSESQSSDPVIDWKFLFGYMVVAFIFVIGLSLLIGSSLGVRVPEVIGMTVTEARSALEDAGLRGGSAPGSEYSALVEAGQVARSDPAAGHYSKRNGWVALFVSLGLDPQSVPFGTVKGRVLWNEIPVEGAKIEARDDYGRDSALFGQTVTDAQGGFQITNIPKGNQYLYVYGNSPEFWVSEVMTFTMTSGKGSVAGDIYLCKGFAPIAPEDESVVADSRPDLRWEPFPGATDYAVRVLRVGDSSYIYQKGDNDPRITSTEIRVAVDLPPGDYQWRVDAFNRDGQIIGCSYDFDSKFTVR